jgi:hypothetical protein
MPTPISVHTIPSRPNTNCWKEWVKLTSDKNILSDIKGVKIERTETPAQHVLIEAHF